MNVKVYYVSKKNLSKVYNKLNKQGVYLTDIKSYLDKNSLKNLLKCDLRGVNSVLVSEDKDKREAHHLIEYNKEYNDFWKKRQPIYGNIIISVGDKTYEKLDEKLKVSWEDVQL